MRRPRPRAARGGSRVGERFEAVVGPVAHGGHCVVRLEGTGAGPDGAPAARPRVVFVRHAIPGERVVVEITEGTDGDRFWRGDAVEVLEASPERVVPPCPFAGPGRCGGCDFQHVTLSRQRDLKADVVREQLFRLAGIDAAVDVEPVPGDEHGLRYRTRIQWATGAHGERGLRKHRSREVVPVDDCRITRTDARAVERSGSRAAAPAATVTERVAVPGWGEHSFAVAADGFWQVHAGVPSVLVRTVLEMLAPRPGETALDLYSGVGLFARFLADAVGPAGRVLSVEGDRTASRHSQANLAGLPGVDVRCGAVDQVLAGELPAAYRSADLVVLDPPREGAREPVVEQVVARAPRAVAYVACDPAALARDLATFARLGYGLRTLRAFDAFPMTHHVECVALLERQP
jgi:tRNA/tmRNA/rRNA uracil-C5-methylase (TrmA/RlmC/RlmD family)